MRIGLFSWKVQSGSAVDILEDVGLAAADGFSSYWIPQVVGLDAILMLTAAALEHPDIEVGTAVVPIQTRHPVALAQEAMTSAALTGGRFTLGVGLSHRGVIETMLGLSYDAPAQRMEEYLSILTAARQGEQVECLGEHYRAKLRLPFADDRYFRILVAALGPRLLSLAGSFADGTITWCTGPQTLAQYTIPTINESAEKSGRPAPRVVAGFPVCVTQDADRVRQTLASDLALYARLPSYRAMLDREGVEGPADLAIVGSEEDIVGEVAELAAAGVSDLAAVVVGSPAEQEETRACLRDCCNHSRELGGNSE